MLRATYRSSRTFKYAQLAFFNSKVQFLHKLLLNFVRSKREVKCGIHDQHQSPVLADGTEPDRDNWRTEG